MAGFFLRPSSQSLQSLILQSHITLCHKTISSQSMLKFKIIYQEFTQQLQLQGSAAGEATEEGYLITGTSLHLTTYFSFIFQI